MDPVQLVAGGPDTVIIVHGVDFVSASVVRWDNTDLETSRQGTGRLRAVVPSAEIAVARQVEIRVINRFNEDAHTTLSLPFMYEIVAPVPPSATSGEVR